MSPTMTVAEALEVYRRYDIPMSQQKLQEMLRGGCEFAEVVELGKWSFTIWRLPFYRYLHRRGVPVVELAEYLRELRERGWRENESENAGE